jgi:diacylglycerol kinase (ATP)
LKLCVIYNPSAGSAQRLADVRAMLSDAEFREAGDIEHVKALVAQCRDDGVETVIAAGGDGTINLVLNAIMSFDVRHRPILGVLPLGTGNDLARTLALAAEDLPLVAQLLREASNVRMLDVMNMRMGDGPPRFGINVAAGGFTRRVNDVMSSDLKKTWGPLAYLRGAIKVLPDVTDYQTSIRYDGSAWEEIKAMNVIVANCRTAGGGIDVSPQANPEDGLLDVVVINSGSVLQLTAVAAKLMTSGNYLDARIVTHRRAQRVEIECRPGMWFNIDGELIGNEPVVFSVERQALRVIVGPDYCAEPPG